MTEIPKQLQKEEFKFILLKKQSKIPVEKDWANSNNYKFDDEKLLQHLRHGGNYGVVGGFGNLVIIDTDKPKITEVAEQKLPATFTVLTGRGGRHFYYLCPELKKPIRLMEEKAGDLGDVQGEGKQVVGANCLHPNGNHYKVIKDIEIATVKEEQIKLALANFLKGVDEEAEEGKDQRIDYGLSIGDVIDLSKLKKHGNEYYGSHPLHGSEGGMNFWVNPEKNMWHCFRCDSGGGALSWIAIKEGIIKCSDAIPGALRNEKFLQVLKIGKKKYGLMINEGKYFCYEGKRKIFLAEKMSNEIMQSHCFLTTMEERPTMYYYNDGTYHPNAELIIKKEVKERLGDGATKHRAEEIIFHIQAATYIKAEKFNTQINLIPLENGIFDLTTQEIKAFNPSILITVKLPIFYDPKADCPKIKKFLSQILRKEDIPLMQEINGYCLFRSYPIQKAFIFVGDGANAKSTLLTLIKRFIGRKNIASVSLQDLNNKRFSTAELFGKLANIYADLAQQALNYTGTFKMVTGGDEIPAEKKFKSLFYFVNFAKLLFSANRIPEVKEDDSNAFFRRWIIITFPNKFEGKKADKDIISKLTTKEEISGLFNWALEGLHRLLKNGHFSYSVSTEETREKYIRLSSPVGSFIQDCLMNDTEGAIEKDHLYSIFVSYCQKNNLPTYDKARLSKELYRNLSNLSEERPTVEEKRVRCWRGIGFKKNLPGPWCPVVHPFHYFNLYRVKSNKVIRSRDLPRQMDKVDGSKPKLLKTEPKECPRCGLEPKKEDWNAEKGMCRFCAEKPHSSKITQEKLTTTERRAHDQEQLKSRILIVRDAIKRLESRTGKLILIEELVKEVHEKSNGKYDVEDIEDALDKLSRAGDIFKPKRGFVQRI